MAFEYLSNVPLDEAVEGFLEALAQRGMAPRAALRGFRLRGCGVVFRRHREGREKRGGGGFFSPVVFFKGGL